MSPRRYPKGNAVPEAGPKPIPSGRYLMDIKEVKFGQAKTSGHDMVTAWAAPVDGEFQGKKVRFFVTFPPVGGKSWGQTLHFLKTIGEPWQGPEGDEDNIDVDETRWIGRRFWGVVETEMFNGLPSNKIKFFHPIEEPQPVGPVVEDVPF